MKFTLISLFLVFSTKLISAEPFCVSHRGLGYGEVENSLSALKAAGMAEAQAVEFDLHHTKDNQTIIYHDNKLKRLITGSGCPSGRKVHELKYSEILNKCFLENGEQVPLFEDSLKLMSSFETSLFVELKDWITDSDFELIKEYYGLRPEKIVIISFSREALELVNKKRLSDPFFKKVKTILLKKFGYLGNIDNFDGIDAKYINKKRVKSLKEEGKLVGVYTKDSKKKIQKYLKKGVDFITTNKPILCESIISLKN